MDKFREIRAEYRRINEDLRDIESKLHSMEREVGLRRIIAHENELIAVQNRIIENLRQQVFQLEKMHEDPIEGLPLQWFSYLLDESEDKNLEKIVDSWLFHRHGPGGPN